MILKNRKITDEEYVNEYYPLGAWILVERDQMPTETEGGIILSESARVKQLKWGPTGVIVRKSLFTIFQNEYDEYFFNHLKVGDRVGFGSSVPTLSPAPPFYDFTNSDSDDAKFITLHGCDGVAVLCDTKEKREEYEGRFK